MFRTCCHVVLVFRKPTVETPCSPVSQISDTLLPVAEATEIMVFRENYQQPALSIKLGAQSRRILKWLVATGLAISK